MISLESFVVLKKLCVENIRIEPNKIKADYRIMTFSGEESSKDLIYSYEEKYFEKGDPQDFNLASMILAQVAINYGLFFEMIEFRGSYEPEDRKFISGMIENTSREIITNKLLVKNEFLKSPYDTLKIDKRVKYTNAKIIFKTPTVVEKGRGERASGFDPNKFAILSSGGKDSLLTYGIIKEIGNPYPVFINESGRHWFTAVNSHKYLKENEPNTRKPWCNSDRVFNFILRHLPFIREDYASLRSDIYPVRLWTVAVFLFGVLPVVFKNEIGNVLIGDEYDTTMRTETTGISHYSGLYDQSKYFDNAMTRYFKRKGWKINQFSILRSMSEMLIMKTLIKRYPELQEHQISCHAASSYGGRIRPCGKCEKCRRIVGMVKALDEDPSRCGYTEAQIYNGLAALEQRSVKQIGPDAAHLYYLLMEKNLIKKNKHTEKLAIVHPEIMKLRFDKTRSNLEDLPEYVRGPIFNILQKYSDGAVRREEGRWSEFILDEDFLNSTNYIGEKNEKQ